MQLLISQQYLTEKTIIDSNTDFDKLVPVIEFVQFLKIRPLLGNNLYNLILTESQAALSAANQTLLDDYILPAMRFYILSESVMIFKYRYQNTGIMVKRTNDSDPIDAASESKLIDYWKNKAEEYGNALQLFIRANPTDYPTFFNNEGLDEVQPLQSSFDIDMYLPDIQCKTDRDYI